MWFKIFKILALFFLLSLTSCDEVTMARIRAMYGRALPGDAEIIARYERQISGQEADSEPSDAVSSERSSADDDNCDSLIETAPRGLACLHCTQPEARTQARILSLLLKRSCLKNIAIDYLVDGTFSFDEAFLFDEVEKLTTNGRRLFVYFYVSNGSTPRRWNTTEIDAFGTRMEPGEFRQRIQYDPELQSQFQQLVYRIVPLMRYAVSRGAIVSVIPSLEDNLSNQAFNVMFELALDAVPADLPVAFGRSDCPSCYPGNEAGVPDGLFEDVHTSSPFISKKDGLVTNDGVDYVFDPTGFDENGVLTLDDLKAVRDSSANTNNAFILWNAKRQGLPGIGDDNRTIVHPSKREFQIPTIAERLAIISFLRGE